MQITRRTKSALGNRLGATRTPKIALTPPFSLPPIFRACQGPKNAFPTPHVADMPAPNETDALADSRPLPEIPELSEIAVDSEGGLIGINIDIADVEKDPTL